MKDWLFTIVWNTRGFDYEDLPEEEWEQLKEEFLRLRNQFCELVNGPDGYKKLNVDFFNLYPDIKYVGDQNIEGYMYGSYLAWRISDMMYKKMQTDENFMKSNLMEPYVFMDGSAPDFGVQLKTRKGCTIDILLKEEEG